MKFLEICNFLIRMLIFFTVLFQGMYPDQPPMWFSESEDGTIANIIESVGKISTSSTNLLLCMLRYLVTELLKATWWATTIGNFMPGKELNPSGMTRESLTILLHHRGAME